MAKRQVSVTLATYIDVKGFSRFALQGQTVDVHPDHIERFDLLNVIPGAEQVASEVAEPEPAPVLPEPAPQVEANISEIPDSSVLSENAAAEVLNLDAPRKRGRPRKAPAPEATPEV